MKEKDKTNAINILLKKSPSEFMFWIDLFDDSKMINISSYINFMKSSSLEQSVIINFGRGRYLYKESNFVPEFHKLFQMYIFFNKWQKLRFLIINQIRSQLMRIVPVHSVNDLTEEGNSVEAEVSLILIDPKIENKKEIYHICDLYRARKIENENNSIVFEIAGTSERIDSFIKDISKNTKIEIVRSGPVALSSKIQKKEDK